MSVSPVPVTALLRKSAAFDFLHKVREKRAAECFPGGCSTEVSETQELIEVDSGYVSSHYLDIPPHDGLILQKLSRFFHRLV